MITLKEIPVKQIAPKSVGHGSKLHALHPFIDSNKSVSKNADALLVKAKELGITTTHDSLRQMMRQLYKNGKITVRMERISKSRKEKIEKSVKETDVSIQMLDDVIKGLQDIRAYIVSTTKENEMLRARVEKLKQVLG